MQQRNPFPSIWVAMSGGGFRATLFHYGCLKRLHERGLLGHIYGVSATSGGALAAALLGLCAGELRPSSGTIEYDWERFERYILTTARQGLLAPSVFHAVGLTAFWLSLSLAAVGGLENVLSLVSAHKMLLPGFFDPHVMLPIWMIAALAQCLYLIAHGCLQPYPRDVRAMPHHPGKGRRSFRPLYRFLHFLLDPAAFRTHILNRRLFGGFTLFELPSLPKIYLTAVELDGGREKAFGKCVAAPLNRTGCQDLWEQRTDTDLNDAENVYLASAVAASSAYLPWFSPVAIYLGKVSEGIYVHDGDVVFGPGEPVMESFVDGGFVDNNATRVPEAFCLHVTRQLLRFRENNFSDLVSTVLILDASAPITHSKRKLWLRWRAMGRILDIVQLGQVHDAMNAAEHFRQLGIRSAAVGLRFGFPIDSELCREDMKHLLGRIRTNFDSFSPQECAVLAYCGYVLTDLAVREGHLGGPPGVREDVPLCEFSDILPKYCGEWDSSSDVVASHLSHSDQRVSLLRWIRRLSPH